MLSLLVFGIIPLTWAHPSHIHKGYTPTKANCVDYKVPVTVSTQGVSWIAPKWSDDYGLTDIVSVVGTRTTANFSAPISGPVAINGNYTVSATFCSPKTKNETSSTVL